jgi:hypothetical protein
LEPDEIESAFDEFVLTLRNQTFEPPGDGWSAELIGAHVANNNDLIAEMAEKVARGESPSYDNAHGVNDNELRAYVARVGDVEGVADDVVRSARRQLHDSPRTATSTRQ